MYDECRDKFEDWCDLMHLSVSSDHYGDFTHPTTKEYWIVWKAAWKDAQEFNHLRKL